MFAANKSVQQTTQLKTLINNIMQSEIKTSQEIQEENYEKELKSSILFFLKHLSIKELLVLRATANLLAQQYSESYAEWLKKNNSSSE